MTDPIERQDAIGVLEERLQANGYSNTVLVSELNRSIGYLMQLPPAQPEIIRCRNCKFASGDSRICMKFDHSPIGELDFCAWAERRTDEE